MNSLREQPNGPEGSEEPDEPAAMGSERGGPLGVLLMRRSAVTLAVGLLMVLVTPIPPAQAHAALLRSDPSDGSVLPSAPSMVRLTFSEPVTPIGAGLRVVGSDGSRVDLGPASADDGRAADASVLAVALPLDLADGGYLAVWRVRSVDGHAIAGTLRFTVGDSEPVADELIDALAAADAPAVVRMFDRGVRGLLLLMLLLSAGTAAAAVLLAREEQERRSAARIVRMTSLVALPLVPGAVWLQGAVQAGSARATLVLDALSSGPTVPVALVRTAGLALLLLVANRRPRPVTHLPAAALVLLPLAAEGHQRSTGGALLPLLDSTHLIGAALWLSSVALLASTLRSARHRSTRLTDRGTPDGLTDLARRVARLVTISLLALTAAGLAQARLLIGDITGLTGTPYGRALVAKVGLVALAVIAASLARRRAHRSSDGWARARGLLRTEVALISGAVILTGTLVTLPPPASGAGTTMFTTSAPLADALVLDVGVDTSRPGRTEIHLYIIETTDRGAALSSRSLDVRVSLTSVPDGIGPLTVAPALVEPGHWFAALEPLPPGTWELEVVVGLDRFTERSVRVLVPLP